MDWVSRGIFWLKSPTNSLHEIIIKMHTIGNLHDLNNITLSLFCNEYAPILRDIFNLNHVILIS